MEVVACPASEVLLVSRRWIMESSARCLRETSKLVYRRAMGAWPSTSLRPNAFSQGWCAEQRHAMMLRDGSGGMANVAAQGRSICVQATAGVEASSQVEAAIPCASCSGRGWLICDFCDGKKTDVPAKRGSKFYRRCPTCRAAGVLICPICSVYKCVTFPEGTDGGF